ncbi:MULTISPECIES: GDP-mannose 4,6-dehydratase [Brevibacillus]|jgi:GDP-4-dehydro-6-deoxy-D-mannose reductase|uniref:NAD-dependent epimerase/dehydratase n=1 Tax=Brevibacillus borstelensis AK1 TaxID=1300222 RepID=M8ED37_9BACL|nr:GDP-mannose 4,6-dehydratase [Brevibacillus borstelensis]EMT53415.1 NAD-dependent epimerase/dehydratase [Brevibacillus borstelensis AK1]KKX53192.1 NAD-dependent epimerase [Brevibacillus borstelensis cifa_chp40]MBE5394871.1 GDP-mannose 4,6-dehydratase [Brevibacillus borstelensis]MCM3590609.1 GDP-mannose 4,6-dehydratase [Brevibacillus borstelensis]MED1745403.1 GDP-mannose 4,6-dehydratase [Brevibacillus borstelensis]
MPKALITGITGFAGSHLAEWLLANKKDMEVYGTYRLRSRMDHIKHIQDDIHMVECELKDPRSVDEMIKAVKPDYIFHLAAQSFVPTSWNAPAETLIVNQIGQVNLFEAILKHQLDCTVQIACSSEEYGQVYAHEVPIKEDNPLRPLSPYAVSKVGQDYLGYQYYQSYGLKTIRTRTFNHTGPRRGEAFVTSNFAKQIAEIEKGIKPPVLYVGNLQAKRDFTDVRDVVRAYWLAVEKGVPGEVYNIASGVTYTIEEMLNKLLSLSQAAITITPDPSRMRPSDVEILLGNYDKFHQQTGWKPEIPFEQTLKDLLDYWRARV